MKALLILSLLAAPAGPGGPPTPDELAEARKLQGPLLGATASSWGEALKDVRAVWQCAVMVRVIRRVEDVTPANLPGSAEDEDRLQEVLRPIAQKAGLASGLLDPKLGSLDPELEISVQLFPVDEETEETWSVEVRAQLQAPARLLAGAATFHGAIWEMSLVGVVRQADLDTVLASAVEREVKAAAGSVKKARAAAPRSGENP